MAHNALMSGFNRVNGTGSHLYPDDVPRVYPTPPFVPGYLFNDDIFVSPAHPAARSNLLFDRMDLLEQNPNAFMPPAIPYLRGLR